MAQAKARHPDLKDRYFNVGFIINPRGRGDPQALQGLAAVPGGALGLPARRLRLVGREVRPQRSQAFWPVVDTEIGRLGIMMANEGSYPENARALAHERRRGRLSRLVSASRAPATSIFEIQSRARALDNNMYVVAPNMGTYYLFPEETDADRHVRRPVVHHRLQGPASSGARTTAPARPTSAA